MSNTSPIIRFLASGFSQKSCQSLFFCTLIYGIISCSTWAETPTTALDWVKRMAKAGHSEDYSQTFIYENQSGISTIKMLHAQLDGHEYERILFLNGLYHEFLRKDSQIISLHNQKKDYPLHAPKSMPFSQTSAQSLAQLQQFYSFKKVSNTRIADRDCIEISVSPKDKFRYGYRLWIDKKTGLMLRVDLLNENQLVLDRFMVTQIQPNLSLTLKDFPWPEKNKEASPLQKPEKNKRFPWSVSWLPNGFEVVDTNITQSPVNGENVHYVLYSDGLSAFSVYVEKDTSRILSQSADRFGATSAVSRVFKTGKNAYYNITVIGELPLGSAERIAVSIQPETQSSR